MISDLRLGVRQHDRKHRLRLLELGLRSVLESPPQEGLPFVGQKTTVQEAKVVYPLRHTLRMGSRVSDYRSSPPARTIYRKAEDGMTLRKFERGLILTARCDWECRGDTMTHCPSLG